MQLSSRFSTSKHGIHVIGDVMVLNGEYDPDQLWLPFMDRVIVNAAPPVQEKPVVHRKPKITTFASVPVHCQVPYVYDPEIWQEILPFAEFRHVTNAQLDVLEKARFPTWERETNGCLAQYDFKNKRIHTNEVIEWCKKSCGYRFHIRSSSQYAKIITFQRVADLVLAKLKFG
jgi:hypothetical protein